MGDSADMMAAVANQNTDAEQLEDLVKDMELPGNIIRKIPAVPAMPCTTSVPNKPRAKFPRAPSPPFAAMVTRPVVKAEALQLSETRYTDRVHGLIYRRRTSNRKKMIHRESSKEGVYFPEIR